MVDLESVWIKIEGTCLGMIRNSEIGSFNYSAYEQVVFRVISSASIVL